MNLNTNSYIILHNNKLGKKNKNDERIHGHFTLIVSENSSEYYYLTLTHSATYKDYKNIKLINNPNSKDKNESYLIPSLRHMGKEYFNDTARHLVLSNEDEKIIDMFLEKERIKKMKNFELKLKEIYELQNKFDDNSKWLRNHKTVLVTDYQAKLSKIYDENDSIRNKIKNIFQEENFVNELNKQAKNNYAKLEQFVLSTNKNNNKNYLFLEFNEYDDIVMPNLENVKLNNDLISLLKKQDFLINILRIPNSLRMLEPETLLNPELYYYKIYIKSNDSNEKEYEHFRLNLGDGPKYNVEKFTILEQKVNELENKEKEIMKEKEIKEQPEATNPTEAKKETIYFQIEKNQILPDTSENPTHKKVIFPKGSKYENFTAVFPTYCVRGENKYNHDLIDIMLPEKIKPIMYINNIKVNDIAQMLDKDLEFNKMALNLNNNQCVITKDQVLHKTEKAYIVGLPKGSTNEAFLRTIIPIDNVQELSDSRLKLSLLNTQVMQPRNSLSNDFLAKALCYKEKSRLKEVSYEHFKNNFGEDFSKKVKLVANISEQDENTVLSLMKQYSLTGKLVTKDKTDYSISGKVENISKFSQEFKKNLDLYNSLNNAIVNKQEKEEEAKAKSKDKERER